MKRRYALAVVLCFALLSWPGHAAAGRAGIVELSEGVAQSLVGTWTSTSGDLSAFQSVTLELHGDGTYTKTLNATVGGSHYGGQHEGRWTAEGKLVRLSGSSDSKWPPYTHDLNKFQKVK